MKSMFSKRHAMKIAAILVICCLLFLGGCHQNNQPDSGEAQAQTTYGRSSTVQSVSAEQETNASQGDNSSNPSQEEAQNMPKPEELKLSDTSFEAIDSFVKGLKYVRYGWSNNRQYAAFILQEPGMTEDFSGLYLWKVGETEPCAVKGAEYYGAGDFYWSPDDSYLIFDTGTYTVRGGDICYIKTLDAIERIGYLKKPVWSPDSKWVAVGIAKPIQTVVDTSLEGSSDLYIYNIETKERRLVAEGTKDYYLVPKEWDKDGNLIYEKYYFTDMPKAVDVTVKPDTNGSKAITFDDQEEVQQLINAYYKALEEKDYDTAAKCLTSQGKLGYENTTPKDGYWPSIQSLKLVSLEGFQPSNILDGKGSPEGIPTVYFIVSLDVKADKINNPLWKDGINKFFVNVVKENSKWEIYYSELIR